MLYDVIVTAMKRIKQSSQLQLPLAHHYYHLPLRYRQINSALVIDRAL